MVEYLVGYSHLTQEMTVSEELICDPPPRNESLCARWSFSRFIILCSENKFYAICSGETHFQIRGPVAELHVFEYGGTDCIQVRNCKRIYLIRLLCLDSFGSVSQSYQTQPNTAPSTALDLLFWFSAVNVCSLKRPLGYSFTLLFGRREYVNLSNHRLTLLPSTI